MLAHQIEGTKVLIGTVTVIGELLYHVPQSFAAWFETQQATVGQTTNLYAITKEHHGAQDVIVRFETDPIEWVTIKSSYRSHITTSIFSPGGGVNIWSDDDGNCNGKISRHNIGFGCYDYYQAPGLDAMVERGEIKVDLLPGYELSIFGYTLTSAFSSVEENPYWKPEYNFHTEKFAMYDKETGKYLGHYKDRDGHVIEHIYYDKPQFSSYKFYRLIAIREYEFWFESMEDRSRNHILEIPVTASGSTLKEAFASAKEGLQEHASS